MHFFKKSINNKWLSFLPDWYSADDICCELEPYNFIELKRIKMLLSLQLRQEYRKKHRSWELVKYVELHKKGKKRF